MLQIRGKNSANLFKTLVSLVVLVFFIAGCSTISNLVDQGLKEGEKALDREAAKMVDKEAGSGTYEDMKNMDQDKIQAILTYYSKLNKACDDGKITAEVRDTKKNEISKLYDEYKAGKITKSDMDSKCNAIIKIEDTNT